MDLKKILISLGMGKEGFFEFVEGRVHSYSLAYNAFPWGDFPILNEGILTDIRLVVPSIVDEKTLLVNIHEYAHAYELYQKLGKEYVENKEKSEEYAIQMEESYKKI